MEYRNLKIGEWALVRRLFESYYDPGIYCTEKRYFDWLHHHNPQRLDYVAEDELTVLGAIDGNELVGCINYVPSEVYLEGRKQSAVFTTESLAKPEASGVYGLLARRLVGRFDYSFMMGATEFLRDLYVKNLGAEYSHEMRRFLLIGEVASLARVLEDNPHQTAIDVEQLESWAGAARQFANGQSWQRIAPETGLRDDYWQELLSLGVPSSRRDPTWLDWRYRQHPHVRYEFIAAESSQASGIAVVRHEPIPGHDCHAVRLLEFLPTAQGRLPLAGAVAQYAIDSGCALMDFFCAHQPWIAQLPQAFIRPEDHLGLEIPYLLQPPEWRPRRSINLLSIRNPRRRQKLPSLADGQIYITKGDGAQDVALNEGYRSAHLRQGAAT